MMPVKLLYLHVHMMNPETYVIQSPQKHTCVKPLNSLISDYKYYINIHFLPLGLQCTILLSQCTILLLQCTILLLQCTILLLQCTILLLQCTILLSIQIQSLLRSQRLNLNGFLIKCLGNSWCFFFNYVNFNFKF